MSTFNFQASVGQHPRVQPIYGQQSHVERRPAGQTSVNYVAQLVRQVKQACGSRLDIGSVQHQLHRRPIEYNKTQIAELVWYCAVGPQLPGPELLFLKAVVMPGGIWQKADHGCWTQLQITYSLAVSWGISHPSTLLHEVALHAQSRAGSREVINMIIAKNPGTLTASYESVHNCQPPVNVAMYFGRPPEIVLQLAPVFVAAIWQTKPTPLQYLDLLANDPELHFHPSVIRQFQPYHRLLTLRSIEFAEAEGGKRMEEQKRLDRQKAKDEHYQLATRILDRLPDVVLAATPEDQAMTKLNTWLPVLHHVDNLSAVHHDGSTLCAAYNKGLTSALLTAANTGKSNAVPLLADVFSAVDWQHLRMWRQLQPAQTQLLEQSIYQGHMFIVQLLVDANPQLLRTGRPPLCLAVQGQQSLPLIQYLLVPCQQQRPPLGIDEQEKGKSALGYALQSGQNEEVIKTLIAYSRMDQKQQMKLAQDAAAADASAPASSRPSFAGSKSSSLCPMYPHMYAVELKRLAWLLEMIASAEKCFHQDELEVLKRKLKQKFSETEKQRISEADSRRAAGAAEKKKADWVNIQIGATNPPTALFRAVELGEQEAAEALMLHGADPFKTCHRGEDETTPLHKAIELGNIRFVRRCTTTFASGSTTQRPSLQAACNGLTPLLRAVQCQQFEIALLLLEAGADPAYIGTTDDGQESLPPLNAVMHAIPPGDHALEKAGLKLLKQMLSRVATPAAGQAQRHAELGPSLLHQATSRGLPIIAAYFLDKRTDATACLPARHDPDRSTSTLLLLLDASEEMPPDEPNTGTADGEAATSAQRSAISQEAAQQTLSKLLGSWTKVQTVKAAHPSMLPEDQQRVLDWMLQHKDVTILKFAKDKKEQRDLVQRAVNAKSLALVRLLVDELKLSCAGCHLHGIVAEAPLDLLVTLMKLAGSLNARHPELKSTLIHKAVEAGRVDVAQKLIDFGVQLSVYDGTMNTPLHLAVRLKDEGIRHQMALMLLTSAPTLAREVNKMGQKPIGIISHKKKLREWYQAVEQEVKDAAQKKKPTDREQDASEDSDQSPSEEEAGTTNGLLLTKPDEPMDRRQRRIKQLMEDMPALLRATAEAEAAAAAAAKASQTELPPTEKVSSMAEFEGARSDLMAQLPAELPGKDMQHGAQPGVAAPEEVVAPLTEDQLIDSLVGLPWEFIINKDARQEWAKMDRPFRLMVIKRLQRIGEGRWEQDNGTQQRLSHIRDLEVYRTLLTRGGRIVFEVAVDYSQTARIWKDMIRLWVITLDHAKYERELNNIPKSHSKSIQARDNMKLRPVMSELPKSDLKARLPKLYRALDEDADDDIPRGRPFVDVELREHFPAASSSQDTYTLLKFYNLSKDLVKTVLRDMGEVEVDFPFRVSPSEQAIIESDPDPPCSIVLVGRSGTGKTTCAVFRMWARWLTFRHHSAESFHQIFLTANPKLRSEVAKQFHKLRAAILRNPEESKRLEDLSNQEYTSLADIPSDAFPLFWTTKQFLRAVDATLLPTPLSDGPFFPRLEGGELEFAEHAHNEDMGGIESLVDLDAGFADDEEYDEDDEDLADGDRLVADAGLVKEKKGLLGPKKEADYDYFVSDIWPRISTKEEKQSMTAPLVWQEICSFLKGSSEALESPSGKLTLEAYLEVGRKRAPNFTAESRQQVYPIFERYEREKLRLNRYDHLDMLFHIFSSLKVSGYQGVPIHNITRDEVQDFTQAELLVDLRVMCDPNGLFCCGDPCQTIARGIVFRFADICTLFHHESQRRKDAGGVAAATIVGVPKKPLHLPTNYRTHSGILNAAAAVVDILKHYFSMHIDNLPRERAFFKGPAPLLLSSLSPDDLTFLLLGSDPKTSQVEFGAHQVILGRSAESLKDLPPHLRESNVLQMTVAQSKGLEFDDVFLWDFFNGSQAEWRPLNNYVAHLQEVEETDGHKKLPAGTPLVEVEVDPGDKGALRLAREACPDVLLCEELKHLYTALTRAKNNVVVFDSNTAKRAPFFNYLRRLGMAQYVSRSVMEDHTDDSRYVLTQGKNSSEDWVARGQNFMDSRLYDLAAHCYKVAQDPVRFTVATAYGSVMAVRSKQASLTRAQIRQEHFRIGHELLAAAGRANTATCTVSLAERKTWFSNAARMFYNSPEGVTIAARLYKELGNHRMAVSACLRGNDLVGAAESCEEEAKRLTGEAAQARLQEAIKHYKKAKQYLPGFQLLQRHPELAKKMTSEHMDELAEIAMTAHHQQGEHDKALEAARLIRSVPRQAAKLQTLGYWKELADLTQDNRKAARLLAEHGHVTAAVKRLMQPLHQAARAARPVMPTWADKETLSLLYTYCTSLNSEWALQQMGAIVDSFEGQDPFDGDGYMAKGRYMQMQADCSRSDVLQQYLKAMAQYRGRQEMSSCRCIAALAACLYRLPQQEVDFPWPAKKVPGWRVGPAADPVVEENYLTWTSDCSKLAQVMMEGLTSRRALAEHQKEALRDMEEYFDVKGLVTKAASVTYKRHNARVHGAIQAAAADETKSTNRASSKSSKPITAGGSAANRSAATSSSSVEAERSVAVKAIAAELLQMLLPALLKMSNAAVRKSLQDDQAQGSRSLGVTSDSALEKVNRIGQAMKLLDLFSKIVEGGQQLKLSMADSMTCEIHQLRLQLLANIVQLMVPLAPVPDITASLIAPFRKVAATANLRYNPGVGLVSLTDLASDMLLSKAVSHKSQNQNAGFSGWFVLAVALQNSLQVRREVFKYNTRSLSKLPRARLLRIKNAPKSDIQLLISGCEEFAGDRPEEACQALLFYMERCRVLDSKPERQPGHALALEAHLLLVETVGAAAALGLGIHTFLPDLYMDNLEHNPLLGQAGSRNRTNQEGKRVAPLKRLWLAKVTASNTLSLVTRVVRLLYNLMDTIIGNQAAIQQRTQLVNSVLPAAPPSPSTASHVEGAQEAAREGAAARVALLAVTILTALNVHTQADKDPKIKPLLSAAWRVLHLAEDCISNEGICEALKRCRQAGKVGDLLTALRALTYRLDSGLTQVSKERQVTFDQLLTPAPGLNTSDPNTKHLLSLANARCTPYTAERLKSLGADVRQMLLMPVESEVAAFTGSADKGARQAAAALVIQEAYRMYRHRQLVKAKMRWLRTSRLWRDIFQKWTARAKEQLRLRREAAAVVAMEERRKRYQADAQQRLAWVDEGLAQRLVEDSTCPVCCADAGKKAATKAAAERRAADGDSDEEEEDEEDQPGGANPFAALAVNAAPFVPHKFKDYHLEALAAFQAYKQFYTEQAVPLLTEQQEVESAMQEVEARAALDAEVLNKLHGQRFKLEQSLKKLQDSMNLLEKEHAWQNHVDELNVPMQQHQAVVQDTKDWLKGDEQNTTVEQAETGPVTPEKAGSIPWGEAKAGASWNSPEQEQPELADDYGYDDVFNEESFDDWAVVENKKKKKGKQAARPGNVPRARAARRI